MELYIFDRDLNFKGLVEEYFSLRWVRRYSRHGEFELHCGLTPKTLNLLKRGNVIWKKDDLEAGYIGHRHLMQDLEGKEILIVRGKFLTGYLSQRIVWGRENLNMSAELAVREVIDKNAINPIDMDRKIDLMAFGEVKNFTETINKQVSYKNLLEVVEEISNTSELGFRTIIDIKNKQMIFDIYKGMDRTSNQNINSPAIFSQEFENVLEQEYIDSLNDYKNTALIAGEGEGEEREKVSIEEGQGLDRYELYVDARDLQKEEMTLSEYQAKLEDRGITRLAEHKEIETFESKININSNLIYKEDFNLGDIVTCTSKKWGVTIDTRITEIEEVYEKEGRQVNIVFGNEIPTLVDKIKQVVK